MITRIETLPATAPSSYRDDRAAETADLLRIARTAPEAERRRCLQKIVVLHLDLAEALARRYYGRGIEPADLNQAARLGLVEAVNRADADRGEFLPFAITTIRGCLKRYFRDHGWMVRPPRRVQELQLQLMDAWGTLSQEQGKIPSVQQLAVSLDETPEHVAEASAAGTCFHPDSLDAPPRPRDGTDCALAMTLGRSDPDYDRVEWATALHSACLTLPEEDQRVIYLRFFERKTQQEIAEEIGVSQMQISRMLRRILVQLRKRLGQVVVDPDQDHPAAA